MIRRTVKIQLAVFVAIWALGTLYAGFALIGFDAIRRPFTVTADQAASGGIFTGAEVTYRGVRVGKVGGLTLTDTGVRVALRIDHGRKIPATGTVALVANKSAVGEQYVDLQPATSQPPYFKGGDVIDRAHTRLPISIEKVLVDLDRFSRTIDKQALSELVVGLGDAFHDTGSTLQQLIDASNAVTDTFRAKLPDTVRLIDEGKTVLATARDTSGDLRTFANGLAALTDTLRQSDPSLRRLFDNGVAAAHELDALIEPNQQALAVLVGNLVTVNKIGVARLAGTRETLVALPELVARVPLALPDGSLHNGLVTSNDPPACNYANPHEKPPTQRTAGAADATQQCDNPLTQGGKRTSCWAPPPGDEYGGCTAGTSTSAPYQPTLAPGTGNLTLDSTGHLATVGWEGGQQDVLGDRSWYALLLAALQ